MLKPTGPSSYCDPTISLHDGCIVLVPTPPAAAQPPGRPIVPLATVISGHFAVQSRVLLYPPKRTSVASGHIESTYSFSLNGLVVDFKPVRRAPIRAAMSSLIAQEFDRALGPPCSHAAF